MKKYRYWLFIVVWPICFLSCSDNEDYSEWRSANEAAYENITKNPDYLPVTTPGGPGPVYCKELKKGAGTVNPIQTAGVKVLYKGAYYNGVLFDKGSSLNDVPVTFKLNEVVRGFAIGLQNMVVGDKWEIWIPWELGYGSQGLYDSTYTTLLVQPYSTLIFTVEVLEITQYPE